MYIKCPSCKTLLGCRYLIYEKGLNEINNSQSTDEEKGLKKQKLMEKMELERYCCKPRIMSYIKKEEIIN